MLITTKKNCAEWIAAVFARSAETRILWIRIKSLHITVSFLLFLLFTLSSRALYWENSCILLFIACIFFMNKKNTIGVFRWIFYFSTESRVQTNANLISAFFCPLSNWASIKPAICVRLSLPTNKLPTWKRQQQQHKFNKNEVVRNINWKRIENGISVADNMHATTNQQRCRRRQRTYYTFFFSTRNFALVFFASCIFNFRSNLTFAFKSCDSFPPDYITLKCETASFHQNIENV